MGAQEAANGMSSDGVREAPIAALLDRKQLIAKENRTDLCDINNIRPNKNAMQTLVCLTSNFEPGSTVSVEA